MSDLESLQQDVQQSFQRAFGRTPLRERLDDILVQALALNRFTDIPRLREEAGDLFCSVLQLCNECGWNPAGLTSATLDKISSRQLQYASLGRKTVVALLGGAFDPVHLGHVAAARFILDTSRVFDEVWLMPCFEHMNGKRMAAAEHRLEMCRLAANADGRIKVFDFEIKNQLRGETYFMVKRLLEEDLAQRQVDFSMIIGQDNANSFPTWVNSGELERMIRFVVVQRKGVEFDEHSTWYLKPPHIYLMAGGPTVQISSTEIRTMIRENNPRVAEFLPPAELDYIRRHGLYCQAP